MNERRHEPLAIAVVLAWATVACGSSDAADRTADRAVTDGGIVGSDGSTVLPADGSVTSDGGIVDVLFEGSIHVRGSRDRDDLDGVTRITGDLVVDAPELVQWIDPAHWPIISVVVSRPRSTCRIGEGYGQSPFSVS